MTLKQDVILTGCGVRKIQEAWEEDSVFRAQEVAFTKVGGIRESGGTLEVLAGPACGQRLDEGAEGESGAQEGEGAPERIFGSPTNLGLSVPVCPFSSLKLSSHPGMGIVKPDRSVVRLVALPALLVRAGPICCSFS